MPTTVPLPTYQRRIVSVLFADLVGFTSLSERLDPEDVAAIQDRYFGAVREAVERYRGVLEKFIGDAAMAAFGVPTALDDDAERAARCGLAITAAVERLDAELGLESGVIAVRVGIATGEVVYADTGPDAGPRSVGSCMPPRTSGSDGPAWSRSSCPTRIGCVTGSRSSRRDPPGWAAWPRSSTPGGWPVGWTSAGTCWGRRSRRIASRRCRPRWRAPPSMWSWRPWRPPAGPIRTRCE